MLRSINDLRHDKIRAKDDEIGSVDDFLFDDEHWTIRYMVLNTGGWLTGRLVLISPMAISRVRREEESIDVALTRDQIERSPDISTDQPVSRQMEAEYAQYYGYPLYWAGLASGAARCIRATWALMLCQLALARHPRV